MEITYFVSPFLVIEIVSRNLLQYFIKKKALNSAAQLHPYTTDSMQCVRQKISLESAISLLFCEESKFHCISNNFKYS